MPDSKFSFQTACLRPLLSSLSFFLALLAAHGCSCAAAAQNGATLLADAALEKTSAATMDKAYPPQLSGTVVDTSGAVIAGATVQVQSANGTVQRTTRSETNGSF